MSIRPFALLLLLGCATLAAAPPEASTPVEEIDVDAMARAKDVKAGDADATQATDAAAEAGSEAASAEPIADASAPTPESETPASAAQASAPASEADTTSKPADAEAGEGATAAPPSKEATAERRLADACVARANALLDAAEKQDYEKATRDFDAKMRTALPATKFREAWESLAQFGAFKARGQSHPATQEGYIAVTIPLVFEKANLYAQVACGSDGRVAGFYVKPLQLPAR